MMNTKEEMKKLEAQRLGDDNVVCFYCQNTKEIDIVVGDTYLRSEPCIVCEANDVRGVYEPDILDGDR